MGSFLLLCDIYFDQPIQLMVDRDKICKHAKKKNNTSVIIISITIIIKQFYTYFSWCIASYDKVFLLQFL